MIISIARNRERNLTLFIKNKKKIKPSSYTVKKVFCQNHNDLCLNHNDMCVDHARLFFTVYVKHLLIVPFMNTDLFIDAGFEEWGQGSVHKHSIVKFSRGARDVDSLHLKILG